MVIIIIHCSVCVCLEEHVIMLQYELGSMPCLVGEKEYCLAHDGSVLRPGEEDRLIA